MSAEDQYGRVTTEVERIIGSLGLMRKNGWEFDVRDTFGLVDGDPLPAVFLTRAETYETLLFAKKEDLGLYLCYERQYAEPTGRGPVPGLRFEWEREGETGSLVVRHMAVDLALVADPLATRRERGIADEVRIPWGSYLQGLQANETRDVLFPMGPHGAARIYLSDLPLWVSDRAFIDSGGSKVIHLPAVLEHKYLTNSMARGEDYGVFESDIRGVGDFPTADVRGEWTPIEGGRNAPYPSGRPFAIYGDTMGKDGVRGCLLRVGYPAGKGFLTQPVDVSMGKDSQGNERVKIWVRGYGGMARRIWLRG